ncbi:RNA polymerase subunit sigma [Streptomyces sp. NPDC057616]|uniref:RNA polymerase subunit sigma n=1 Tax=Streptomyces sp. NPDC057616 TaxID=3346183 RepID=UPI00367D3098
MDEADGVAIADLVDERRYLLDVACRMLGGAGEAERVVDEVYRLWYGLSDEARRQIVRPRSWLAETAGRSCRSRLAGTGQDACPAESGDGGTEQGDGGPAPESAGSETLAPHQRRETVPIRQPRPIASREQDAVVRAVGRACRDGDGELLASLLCTGATAYVDGGGRIRAPDRPVHGGRQVARTLLTLLADRPRTTVSAQSVNGRTGLVVRYEHRVAAVVCLGVTDHGVAQVWVILNPDKLRSWNRPPGPPAHGSVNPGTPRP